MRFRIENDIRGWDAIADHRTGTVGDRATAEWLADAILEAGAEPRLDAFPFERRVLHECAVAAGGHRADGVPLFDGGLTGPEGVSAPLAPLEANGGTIGVTPFTAAGNDDATRRMSAARHGAATAIVAHAADDRAVPGLALLNASRYDAPFGPPVLQVATKHRTWLEDAAADRIPAHLVAHATLESISASNVLARIPGRDPNLAPLVVLTPRSAWWTCTAERGGGIALMLECVRRFAAEPGERDVLCIATTGHELGHAGLAHYMRSHPSLAADAHAWIHLGANFAATEAHTRYQASGEFLQMGLDILAAEGVVPDALTEVGARPFGEASNVFDAGGRYVSLLGTQRWFHHPDDRWPETIDLERTERLCRAVLRIAEVFAGP